MTNPNAPTPAYPDNGCTCGPWIGMDPNCPKCHPAKGLMKAELNHCAWLERVARFATLVHNYPDFVECPGLIGNLAKDIEHEANTLRQILAAATKEQP